MTAGVTDHLIEGLAKIDNIRVATPRSGATAASEAASASSVQSDFVLHGELQKGQQSWTLRARMIKTVTGEVASVTTASVDINEGDAQLQPIATCRGSR